MKLCHAMQIACQIGITTQTTYHSNKNTLNKQPVCHKKNIQGYISILNIRNLVSLCKSQFETVEHTICWA